MNIRHLVSAALVLLAAVPVTACYSDAVPESAVSPDPIASSPWSAPCNLGMERDHDGIAWVVTYEQPTLAEQTDVELYGGTVANDACTDAQILRWQELRRQSGQSDAICRVIWSRDPKGIIRDLGCAVPDVVVWR